MFTISFRLEWFLRNTEICPCLGYWWRDSESSHSPLPESWERLVAPCKCSFIESFTRGFEETYLGSDGGRYRKACSLGDRQQCRLRVLYIDHITEEATLHCPCGTCSPDWRWGPCNTLGLLYGEDEPGLLEENGDPVIPAQGLTRVGNPCPRLGDPYNED